MNYFLDSEMEHLFKKRENIRILLAYEFKRRSNAAQAARSINEAFGNGTVGASTAREWFVRFKNGVFDIIDQPHTGRPVEFNENHLETILRKDSRQTTRELAEQMSCHHSTVADHLEKMGKILKLGSWVPHELNEQNKNQRFATCASAFSTSSCY